VPRRGPLVSCLCVFRLPHVSFCGSRWHSLAALASTQPRAPPPSSHAALAAVPGAPAPYAAALPLRDAAPQPSTRLGTAWLRDRPPPSVLSRMESRSHLQPTLSLRRSQPPMPISAMRVRDMRGRREKLTPWGGRVSGSSLWCVCGGAAPGGAEASGRDQQQQREWYCAVSSTSRLQSRSQWVCECGAVGVNLVVCGVCVHCARMALARLCESVSHVELYLWGGCIRPAYGVIGAARGAGCYDCKGRAAEGRRRRHGPFESVITLCTADDWEREDSLCSCDCARGEAV